jgi:hypothetical protein
MTRRGCLLGCLVWLVVMTLPLIALLLAVRGELAWRRGDFVEDRVWLVRTDDLPGEEAAGLAYASTRLLPDPNAPAGRVCVRTRVTFLLWRGASESFDYCECYQARPAPAEGYDPLGSCALPVP